MCLYVLLYKTGCQYKLAVNRYLIKILQQRERVRNIGRLLTSQFMIIAVHILYVLCTLDVGVLYFVSALLQ